MSYQKLTPEELELFESTKAEKEAARLPEAIQECKISRELVKLWFEEENVQWGFGRYIIDGRSINIASAVAQFVEWTQLHDVWRINKQLLGEKYVKAGFENLSGEMIRDLYESISTKMAFSPNDEWEKLQELAAFEDDDIIILKSWVWNIKRAAAGKKQEQVPMPMLYSSQQQWQKSTFCERLYSPVAELTEKHDVDILQDKFYTPMWETLLVVDFDEMGGLERTDITTLKKWMFTKYLNARAMHTQTATRYEKRVQAIGSSNKEISEILWDTTGSRRVWQISLKKPLGDACDGVGFIKLWEAIDMNAPCPLYTDGNNERILKRQYEEQRRKSGVELWLEDFLAVNVEEEWATKKLFESYGEWRKENNETELQSRSFFSRLKEAGYPVEAKAKRLEKGGKPTKYVRLPVKPPVEDESTDMGKFIQEPTTSINW